MALTSQALRNVFDNKIEDLIQRLMSANDQNNHLDQIQAMSEELEKIINQKIELLEADFHDHILQGEYLRSVKESFDDLDRHLRASKTFKDTVKSTDKQSLLIQIKHHHTHVLIPLLNIIAKLENDYICVANNTIHLKEATLQKLEKRIYELNAKKQKLKYRLWQFNRRAQIQEINQELQLLQLRRRILNHSLQHDKLNLYYFNHDHPPELKEFKKEADTLRAQLRNLEEEAYVEK